MTKIELYLLPFQWVKTSKLVTKSMNRLFHQYIGIGRNYRSS